MSYLTGEDSSDRSKRAMRRRCFVAMLPLAFSLIGPATGSAQTSGGAAAPHAPPPVAPETHITDQQAKELFRSVDQIMQFASQDSGLPQKQPVKRRLITRDEVERYVTDRFHEDKDTKRMERSEIVLKKFGLLDRDFQLQPFLVSLLKEQIAGYYDNKTKTVNLLNWIAPDDQKPVLAHELTHALQDQHLDLEKWGDQTIEAVSQDVDSDNKHLLVDEADTARDAVAEGQAMAVYVDWGLKPKGVTLRTIPNVMANEDNNADPSGGDSPILTRAPLLLQQSLLFPYREGLNFEQVLLKDKGTGGAFAAVLDHPPSSSFEVMNPRAYEHGVKGTLLRMPDVHPLLDPEYEPYDVGVMGELDVRMLVELFGGKDESRRLTPEWNGGLYYAAQRRRASAQEKSSTASVGIFYLSQWKDEGAASRFAEVYANALGRKYSHLSPDLAAATEPHERVFKTEEGPVLIATSGKQVFISESFDLGLSRKLELLLEGAQGGEDQQEAAVRATASLFPELSGALSEWLSHRGLMRCGLR